MRRWLPALCITLAAAAFTWLNRGERVAVDVGLFRIYRAPLTMVVLLAFLAGMLSMLLLSLRHDRRVRGELRARGLLEPAPPRPAAPVASAWGVAREPARADERTVAYPREDERTAGYPRLDEGASAPNDRAIAYPRLDENASHDDDRTSAVPQPDAHAGADDRTAGFPRLEDDGDGDRYPRLDKDPAA